MRQAGKLLLLSAVALSASLLAGCGQWKTEEVEKNPYAGIVSMEATPVIDYSVPNMHPNILTDARGYSLNRKKTAAVKGHSLPEEYELVEASSEEIVYRGEIKDIRLHEESGVYSGLIDFSSFEKEGTFYIKCSRVGQSYLFSVEKGLYENLFREIYEEYMEKSRKGSLTVSEAITVLQVYEWYSDIFPDEDKDSIPDVLKELKGYVSHMEETPVEKKDEALYAAFLAKFSYHYQKHDWKDATDCLQRASTVFGKIQTTAGKDAESFYALTELFRATGHSTYRKQIAEYKSFFENNSTYLEEPEYLYAAMTYLVTRQQVDVKLCETFMNDIMKRAEEISKRYEEMINPVNAKNNGAEDLLKQSLVVSCSNYVTNNYLYTKVIEEFMHYLMGRNPEAADYFKEGTDKRAYLLLVAQLAVSKFD